MQRGKSERLRFSKGWRPEQSGLAQPSEPKADSGCAFTCGAVSAAPRSLRALRDQLELCLLCAIPKHGVRSTPRPRRRCRRPRAHCPDRPRARDQPERLGAAAQLRTSRHSPHTRPRGTSEPSGGGSSHAVPRGGAPTFRTQAHQRGWLSNASVCAWQLVGPDLGGDVRPGAPVLCVRPGGLRAVRTGYAHASHLRSVRTAWRWAACALRPTILLGRVLPISLTRSLPTLTLTLTVILALTLPWHPRMRRVAANPNPHPNPNPNPNWASSTS